MFRDIHEIIIALKSLSAPPKVENAEMKSESECELEFEIEGESGTIEGLVEDTNLRFRQKSQSIPPEFICPVSNEIMSDPVFVGNVSCDRTSVSQNQSLIIPNFELCERIHKWREAN